MGHARWRLTRTRRCNGGGRGLPGSNDEPELRVAELVHLHDLLQPLGVGGAVLQEVGDTHVVCPARGPQPLHVLEGHLGRQRDTTEDGPGGGSRQTAGDSES